MTKTKRILALLLSFVMIFTSLPIMENIASANSDITLYGKGDTYTIDRSVGDHYLDFDGYENDYIKAERISNNGWDDIKITAKKPGNTSFYYIQYISVFGHKVDEKTITKTVEVKEAGLDSVSLNSNKAELILTEGKDSIALNATLKVQKGDGSFFNAPSVTWSSDNETVAKVSNGTVTAVGEGTAIITASATDTYGNTKTATCEVTVKKPGVTSVTIDGKADISTNGTYKYTATVKGIEPFEKGVDWTVEQTESNLRGTEIYEESTDNDGNLIIKALSAGKFKITATSKGTDKNNEKVIATKEVTIKYDDKNGNDIGQHYNFKVVDADNNSLEGARITLTLYDKEHNKCKDFSVTTNENGVAQINKNNFEYVKKIVIVKDGYETVTKETNDYIGIGTFITKMFSRAATNYDCIIELTKSDVKYTETDELIYVGDTKTYKVNNKAKGKEEYEIINSDSEVLTIDGKKDKIEFTAIKEGKSTITYDVIKNGVINRGEKVNVTVKQAKVNYTLNVTGIDKQYETNEVLAENVSLDERNYNFNDETETNKIADNTINYVKETIGNENKDEYIYKLDAEKSSVEIADINGDGIIEVTINASYVKEIANPITINYNTVDVNKDNKNIIRNENIKYGNFETKVVSYNVVERNSFTTVTQNIQLGDDKVSNGQTVTFNAPVKKDITFEEYKLTKDDIPEGFEFENIDINKDDDGKITSVDINYRPKTYEIWFYDSNMKYVGKVYAEHGATYDLADFKLNEKLTNIPVEQKFAGLAYAHYDKPSKSNVAGEDIIGNTKLDSITASLKVNAVLQDKDTTTVSHVFGWYGKILNLADVVTKFDMSTVKSFFIKENNEDVTNTYINGLVVDNGLTKENADGSYTVNYWVKNMIVKYVATIDDKEVEIKKGCEYLAQYDTNEEEKSDEDYFDEFEKDKKISTSNIKYEDKWYKYEGYTITRGDHNDKANNHNEFTIALNFSEVKADPITIKHVYSFDANDKYLGYGTREILIKEEEQSKLIDDNGEIISPVGQGKQANKAYDIYALTGDDYILDTEWSDNDKTPYNKYDEEKNTLTFKYWANGFTFIVKGLDENGEVKYDGVNSKLKDIKMYLTKYTDLSKSNTDVNSIIKSVIEDNKLNDEIKLADNTVYSYQGFEVVDGEYPCNKTNSRYVVLKFAYDKEANCDHDYEDIYADNGNGTHTHTEICKKCGKIVTISSNESHKYKDHVCTLCKAQQQGIELTATVTLDAGLIGCVFKKSATFRAQATKYAYKVAEQIYEYELEDIEKEIKDEQAAGGQTLEAEDYKIKDSVIIKAIETAIDDDIKDGNTNLNHVMVEEKLLGRYYDVQVNYVLSQGTFSQVEVKNTTDRDQVEKAILESVISQKGLAADYYYGEVDFGSAKTLEYGNVYEVTAKFNDGSEFLEYTGKVHVYHKSSSKKKDNTEDMQDEITPQAGGAISDLRNTRPNDMLTRSEFVGVLSQIFTVLDAGTYKPFEDINGDSNETNIKKLSAQDIVKGYSDAEFGPNDYITREQMYTILARALKFSGKATSLTEEEIKTKLEKVLVNTEVSTWANEGVAIAIEKELTAETENQQGNITRSEAADKLEKFVAIISQTDENKAN